ncbi:alpha/beta hydrolase [uncultured Roseobacter sp.]|uniref:alpha/beta hydrolase n=1 Tax=uncultured Roseobacter sp. TaxID=114847 RepID=UPI002605594E|nr:alpha/beta hydrolase [uncultured Roseobacter sp.]
MTAEAYHALTKAPAGRGPLVFAFHGTGGDEAQFFDLAQELVPGGGVVSPRGDILERGASRFFRRTGEGVYDMQDLARATAKMAGYVDGWTRRYPYREVYGFGYSNGANILAAVMMKRPDLFDRVGLLHPLIPWSPAPAPGLRARKLLITAGRRDPICPWPMTERLVTWSRAQGAEVTTSVHNGGHELRREELVALSALLTRTDGDEGRALYGESGGVGASAEPLVRP